MKQQKRILIPLVILLAAGLVLSCIPMIKNFVSVTEMQEGVEAETSEAETAASGELPSQSGEMSEEVSEELSDEQSEAVSEQENVSEAEITEENQNNILAAEEEVALSEYETIVYNFSEFKAALGSATITTIYFGADITMESGGPVINAAKKSLIIDGVNPKDAAGTVHTLTEYNGSLLSQTITLQSNSGPKSITMRNLTIYGRNYYGTIAIYDTVTGVTTTYENIEYYGPQLVYNRYGTAHFINDRIQIGKFGGISPANEVGEVGGVLFEGNVSIAQVEASTYEIFYFALKGGTIEVAGGAVVNVSTYSDSGFVYSAYNVAFTAGFGSEFYYTAPHQFWEAAGPMSNFTVNARAKVHLKITGTQVSAVLRVLNTLYVGENAELHLIGGGGSLAALRIDGKAVFENPGSVLLYSPAYRPMWYNVAGTISIGAQQVNYWTSAGAGGFNNLPLYSWRKADGSLFTLSGTISAGTSGNFTSITSNYTAEDTSAPVAPSSSSFNLNSARVIAFGRLDLAAEYEYLSGTSARVTGTTKPFANLRMSYTNESGNNVTDTATANAEGLFFFELSRPLPEGTAITVQSSYQYLFSQITVGAAQSTLQFQSIPEAMIFPLSGVSTKTKIIGRENPDWNLVVYNSLGSGTHWNLSVRLTSELSAVEDGSVLKDALVFVNEDGVMTPLDTATEIQILQHTSGDDVEITSVSWDADKGVLLNVPPGIALANVRYAATMRWTLANVP